MSQIDSMRPRHRSRREFLADTVEVAAMVGMSGLLAARHASGQEPSAGSPQITVFSKYLQWLDYQGMAETAAEIGFDGVDLTVRPGGHVLPERVEDDLPKAADAIAKAGISISTIVTAITDPADQATEKILKTAGDLGIRFYRMGYYRYNESDPIVTQLDQIKPCLVDLVDRGKYHGVAATYQNHSGSQYVGAPLWDLHYLLDGLDPRWIGSQFDIRHATAEGGAAWPVTLRLLANSINTLAVKDFQWASNNGRWKARDCPLGEGMVDLPKFAKMLPHQGVACPISLHFQYPLGGVERGARKISVDKKTVVDAMRTDLGLMRRVFGA